LLVFGGVSAQAASQGGPSGNENAQEKTADEKPVDVIIQNKANEFERFRSIVTKKRMEKCPDRVLRKLEEAYRAEAKKLPENPQCYEFMGSGILIEKTTGIGPLQFEAPRADQSQAPSDFTSMNGLEDNCYCLLCKEEGCPWYKAPCDKPSSEWCIGGYFGGKCEGDRTICTVNGNEINVS